MCLGHLGVKGQAWQHLEQHLDSPSDPRMLLTHGTQIPGDTSAAKKEAGRRDLAKGVEPSNAHIRDSVPSPKVAVISLAQGSLSLTIWGDLAQPTRCLREHEPTWYL